MIGDQGLKEGGFVHAGLHGLVGCISAAATGADCAAGALGGVVQSVYAGTLEGSTLTEEQMLTNVNLIGALAGYFASGGKGENVSATASIARSGLQNNYLSHGEALERVTLLRDLGECMSGESDCDSDTISALFARIGALTQLDQSRDRALIEACATNVTSPACLEQGALVEAAALSFNSNGMTADLWADAFHTGQMRDDYFGFGSSPLLKGTVYGTDLGSASGLVGALGTFGGPAVLACMQNALCWNEASIFAAEMAAGDALGGSTLTMSIAAVGATTVFKNGDEILKVFDNAGGWMTRVEDITGQSRRVFADVNGELHLLDDAGELVRIPTQAKITALDPSESEIEAAEYLANLGHNVELRDPIGTRAGGGTSDLVVDGVAYDVYTPITANPDRIISAIAKKNDQATGIVIDLTNTSVTLEQLGDVLARVNGAGATNITNVVIIGN